MLSSGRTTLHAAAVAYAEAGWPVLPLLPHTKQPANHKGCLDASTDLHQLAEWWHRWPFANIGLRTGIIFDVLDIDGETGWASLHANAGPDWTHDGPVSVTRTGQHWLYKASNTQNRQRVPPPFEKLDWRGNNGYIVAPPSIHPDGHQYYWHSEPSTTLPDTPPWLKPYLLGVEPVRLPHKDRGKIITDVDKYDRRSPTRIIPVNPNYIANRQADIVAIAEELGMTLEADASRFATECIFHAGDREPSLKLFPAKNDFKCFGCGVHGNARNLKQGVAWLNGRIVHKLMGVRE